MKQQIQITQKASNVIKAIIFLVFSLYAVRAQEYSKCDKLSKSEYFLINDFFSGQRIDGTDVTIYYKTHIDKEWIKYFEKSNLEMITKNVGIPVTISDKELGSVLTKEILTKISHAILISKPIKLDKSYLNNNVKLKRSRKNKKMHVLRISKPIIIDNLAVFSKMSDDEIPIYIMKKLENKWQIIYTFYDRLVLE